MGAFKQDDRLLTFTTPLGKDVLLPEHLTGIEAISELFFYQLDALATTDTTIDPKKIVGQKVCLAIQATDSGTRRYINGFVSGFEMNGGDEEFNNYRVYIVPSIWALTLNKNTRVFQDMTVVDVIKQVLSTYSISPADETSNTYTKMEYCTQYRETDFAFISRLMEQHGILYYFKHSEDDHTFTLQDVSSKLNSCPIQSKFRYAPQGDRTEGFYDFVITEFHSRTGMVTGTYSAWDFGFVPYSVSTDKQNTRGPLGQNNNEYYDYADSAAAYLKKNDSQSKIPDLVKFFNTMRYQSGDAASVFVKGNSNAICLQTGYNFELSKHPQSSLNEKYLVVHAEHNVRQMPSYRSKSQTTRDPYGNTFTAIPFSIPYRPPFKTLKPVVNGMHTGKVVVNSGEESHMDKYGRVNVQFWWDRQRKANTPDNTWLRVAQSWAGKGWGTYFWPRIDDEVLIDFIEGDPDQPIVVGSVYNGVNMPKYDPAGQYTLSGVLTRSSKNGGADNANELRFEDLKGKEQIFMNAERDYDLHVENSHHTLIGQEQHEQIGADHYIETSGDTHLHIKKKLYEQVDDEVHQTLQSKQVIKVGADRHENIGSNSVIKVGSDSNINVGQNLNEKVGMNYSLNVGMNQYDKVGMVYVVDAGMEAHIKGGMTVVIEGGMGVCLSGPGGFVSIDPSGVTIQGMMVRINSGGASLEGSPAQTQDPLSPDSPTAPKDPKFPGDKPPSQAASDQAGAGATSPNIVAGSTSPPSPSTPSAPPSGPAGASGEAANQVQQATQEAAQAAQQAANQAQQAAAAAQTAAQQAAQQAQQAVNQVTQQARQTYQQAAQAVQQAQQAVSQAAGQAQQAAQQALNQAQQQAQQAAQQAAQAVQQAQQQAQQVEQQAQQAAQQAQQQAQQAEQAAQQAAQQGQQAAQQAAQQAQQAAQQAQQTAKQAQQQAQQAASQVQQAAKGAQQQAQQAAQQAQQSAQQAISQLPKGF